MIKSYSLQKRLLLNTSLVLVFFMVAMSVVLLNAYKSGIQQATFERLTAQFYGLLSAADLHEKDQLFIPEEPQVDQRFNQYASGLSALVFDETETLVWNSVSAQETEVKLPLSLPGEPTLYDIEIKQDQYFQFHFVTEWESEQGDVALYHFVILENKRAFNQVVEAYRNKLLMWLGILAASLLLVMFLVLRWTFKPIRKMSQELSLVKQGLADKLDEAYPREIQLLTESINRFISNEREQSKRYKETLANLAHSLKTPLAVMQSALQNRVGEDELMRISSEQLERMNQIVGYQLQRATAGPKVMAQRIEVEAAIEKLVAGLQKVYADKGINITSKLEKGLSVTLSEGDLYEVCGNLLDNACKWAKSQVLISTQSKDHKTFIAIEDDGPGIPQLVQDAVLSRGKRLDETVEGQGIGMSVVKEIMEAYKAKIEIKKSATLGGAQINLVFKGLKP
ncbi:ATP-binding protein [Kangiella sp. TOML190]|uniref:ATP-binding protein n=1 Tax=Kangiella sp. TOML190 TaxID=2931351 RepID=UPI00203C1E12|nr:ATP-binding protein [Kangiella sp. TOML190]